MEREKIVSTILELHSQKIKTVEELTKKRYLFGRLDRVIKEAAYFLGITGLRGIGKTTLLLQLAKQNKGIYFSADNRELRGVSIFEAVEALSRSGHKKIFIDEIHTKPNWDRDLKDIFDRQLAYVVFAGSSAIKLRNLKADLSRRVVLEYLPPASFREWLYIRKDLNLPKLTIGKIIQKKRELTERYGYTYKYLEEYLKYGGVLYEAKTGFEKTILSTLETIALKDLPILRNVGPDIEENFFKVLQIIATSKRPVELSYSKIGNALGKNKVWVMRFLDQLEKTGTIIRIYPCKEGSSRVRRDSKYFLPIPYRASILKTLNEYSEPGVFREEFFVNHTKPCFIRTSSKPTADFRYNGHIFEIGGANKKKKKTTEYTVVDSLDTSEERIPLFLFGLLY